MKLNLRFNRVTVDKPLLPQIRVSDDIKKLDQSVCSNGEIAQLFIQLQKEFDCYHLQNARYFKHAFAFRIPGNFKTIGFAAYLIYALDWNDKIHCFRYENNRKKAKNVVNELIKFSNKSIVVKATVSHSIPEVFSNAHSILGSNLLMIFYENIVSCLKDDIRFPCEVELKPSYMDGKNIVFSPQMEVPLGFYVRTDGYPRKSDDIGQEPTVTIAQGELLPGWIVRDSSFENYVFSLITSEFQKNSAEMIDAYQNLYLEFLKLLNAETIGFIRADQNHEMAKLSFSLNSSSLTIQAYNWFNDGDPLKRSRRIEAYQSYRLPILACINQNNTCLHKIIDQSAPLSEEISKLFNIPAHALKLSKDIPNYLNQAFLSLLISQLRFNLVNNPIDQYKGLNRTQHKKCWPVKASKASIEQQWVQFFRMVEVEYRWCIRNSTSGIYSKSENVWKHMEKMLVSKPVDEDDFTGPMDMISAFKREIILPLIYDVYKNMGWLTYDFYDLNDFLCDCNGEDKSILEKVLIGDMNPSQIISVSQDWHDRRDRIDQIIASSAVSVDQVWQALVPAQEFQGFDIVPLVSKAELNREGTELGHCVSDYAETCRIGRSAIFTIRDEGKPVSTLELLIDQGEKNVSIAQNKAFRNATPLPKALEAGIWLQDQINTGSLKVNWQELSKQFKLAKKVTRNRSILDDIGYDPNDWLVREQVFNAWKPMMGKNVQSLNYAEWIKLIDFDLIIRNGLIQHYWNMGKTIYCLNKIIWLAKKFNIIKK